MKYHPGEMNYRVTIMRETRTEDDMGGVTLSVASLGTVWAHVRPRSHKEAIAADRLDASALYLFVIRNRSDLRESDRIVWEGVSYNIRGIIQHGGRAGYLEIDAERGVAQ